MPLFRSDCMKVTKEEGRNLMDLCNVVAKSTGIQFLNTINNIIDNIEIIEEVEDGKEHE